MAHTFSQIAQKSAARYATPEAIAAALEAIGAKASQPIDELDVERRLALAGQFVRMLRGVGVADGVRLEHDLFKALDATPTSHRTVVVKDAVSLVAVRNHVQRVTTAMGIPWSEGMRIQSAISDIARHLAQNGGGRIETWAGDERIHFRVWAAPGQISVAMESSPEMPPWLVAAAGLAQELHTRQAHGGTNLELTIDTHSAAAA